MPFILSPNFSKFFQKKIIQKIESLDGVGINFDNYSPEALDEIFFDNNEKFIKNELISYIQLILLNKNKNKYLSKNNLNYKRIIYLFNTPNSIFLIPIKSLCNMLIHLNQHLHFIQLQKEDKFILRYRNYWGHNEFGLNHKFWNNPINLMI